MRAEGIETVRRILCVFPRYTSSFGTFEHAYPLTDGVQAFMPPQGLLLIAAYLPENWPVRFIDENIRPATKEDFEWAEAVFVSGMHIQRQQMNDICRRAHAFDLAVAIGGPSVSACPDYYPSFDYLHVGELGDATNELIARLARDPSRPEQQVVLKTDDRLPMTEFPIPAYELAEIKKYFLGSIQYSSGCPYQCEFCDIPGLYGRNPRLKTPEQIIAELDKLRECGVTGSVYFVDDNFIGNRKAALDLLPHLVEWQKRTGYVMRLACEATLNIAKRPEILEKMREAFFVTVFCGIETPDPDALKAMHKDHNMMVPILEGIQHHQLLRHGSRVRHHHGARHRQAGNRRCAAAIRRGDRRFRCSRSICCRRCRRRRCGTGWRRKAGWSMTTTAATPMSSSCCPTIRWSIPGADAWKSPTSRKSCSRATSTSATTPMRSGSRCRSRPSRRAGPTSGAA